MKFEEAVDAFAQQLKDAPRNHVILIGMIETFKMNIILNAADKNNLWTELVNSQREEK